MARLKTILLILIFTMANLPHSNGATPELKTPDFAFPQTVVTDAKALLRAADAEKGNAAAALRLLAMEELFRAQASIDQSLMFGHPEMVSDQLADTGLTPSARAMMLTLEATVYTKIYQGDQYKYNSVETPALPLPADVAAWSGLQFFNRSKELIDSALGMADSTPISDFSIAVAYNELGLEFMPTVYDFVAARAIDMIETFMRYYDDSDTAVTAVCDAAARHATTSAARMYWQSRAITSGRYNEMTHRRNLLELYRTYASDPLAGYILLQVKEYTDIDPFQSIYEAEQEENEDEDFTARSSSESSEDIALRGHAWTDTLVDTFEDAIRRFPDSPFTPALQGTLSQITTPVASQEVPTMVVPGSDFTIKVNYSFARKIRVAIYRTPQQMDRLTVEMLTSRMPLVTARSFEPTTRYGNTGLDFNMATPGQYTALIEVDGQMADNGMSSFTVTPIQAFVINGCSNYLAGAVDFVTGRPVKGVVVDRNTRVRGNLTTTTLGRTDADGLVEGQAPTSYGNYNYLSFKYKETTFNFNQDLTLNVFSAPDESRRNIRTSILTDRSIYHPGDSISWAVIATEGSSATGVGTILADTKVEVTLYNANSEKLATDSVRTDSHGRAHGTFATAKGTLTGRYTIVARVKSDISSKNVMISDFKAPTIMTEITDLSRDVPSPGSVTITGTARTYSGMPVAGANVRLSLHGAIRHWFFASDITITTIETTTDDKGVFTIVLTPADLTARLHNGKPYTDFIAEVLVTSQSAETAETSRAFTLGKPYTLIVEAPSYANADEPLRFTAEAYDAMGRNAAIPLHWAISRKEDKTRMLKGDVLSGQTVTAGISALAGGNYIIEVWAADPSLADASTDTQLTAYSIKRNLMAPGMPELFLPYAKSEVHNGAAHVTVGTHGDTYVYTLEALNNRLIHHSVTKLAGGFHTIKMNVPAEYSEAVVRIMTIRNGKMTFRTVDLKAPEKGGTALTAETFRDRLVPGSTETWRLRMTKDDASVADAAVVTAMYNRALDELYRDSWPTSLSFMPQRSYIYFNTQSPSRIISQAHGPYIASFPEPEIDYPAYRYMDGYSSYSYRSVMIRGRYASHKNMAMVEQKSEAMAITEDSVEEAEMVMEDSAEAPMLAAGAVTTDSEAEDGGSNGTDRKDDSLYRESEVLQAFWQPELVTDAEGNVDIVFSVPNANVTWQFRAFAWTDALECAGLSLQALANKPVMVQPSLPRFLRQGDRAHVLATVFNNSGEEAIVTTTVEIFDIANGSILNTHTATDTIAADGSALVGIDIHAPTDASAIGYRIRANAGNFSDGEQTAIPILASASTVIESDEFYLNPTDTEPFILTVTKEPGDLLTLQYCQNPIWTVVKALRSLSGNGSTSVQLAGRLFSALAARHIVGITPAITSAIEQWKAHPSGDALTSMLSRNDELKQLLLNQTPWVQAAASESARMAMLADMLDSTKVNTAVGKLTDDIARLQQPDGGFKWAAWASESSEWSTETVLVTMGIARSLGIDLSKYDKMLEDAFSYLQKQATQPKRPDTDITLTLIAAYFPEYKLTPAAAQLVHRTVVQVASGWRSHNTTAKAYDVMILAANGRKTEATKVLESIRQYSVRKPGMGLTFPNITDMRSYATIIQAYAAMDAPRSEIDALRQWVIVQAQALDDLGAYNPDYIIASVLLTGSDWISVPVQQSVTVNGTPLAIDHKDSVMGYFTSPIKAQDGRVNISVRPNGTTPSYGSVISISDRTMADVAARPGRDLSVEKRFLVQGADGQWNETGTLTLGQRVRVQLIIKAKRDLEYVTIDDERAAAFQAVDQLPGYVSDGSLAFYRENLDASTRLFIGYLPRGTYHVGYDMTVATSGTFTSGIATLQSQYAPELTAHSGGCLLPVTTK